MTSPTRRELLEAMLGAGSLMSDEALQAGVDFLCLSVPPGRVPDRSAIRDVVLDHRKRMHRRWDAPGVRRIFAKMVAKHAVWLLESVPVAILAPPAPEQDDPMDGRGRPSQMPAAFSIVSSPTRRRNVSQLLDQGFTGEQLAYAAQMSLRKEGRKTEADIIKKVMAADGPDPTVVQASYRGPPPSLPTTLSADEALVLLFDTNMTRAAYQEVRETSKDHVADIFPPYNFVLDAKKRCHPAGVVVDDRGASVPVQQLVDHTASRLCTLQASVIQSSAAQSSLILTSKYGFDGATGQQVYRHRQSTDVDDSTMFLASMVPLRLRTEDGRVIWANPKPNSTFFCRPISFIFEKESKELTTATYVQLQQEVESLTPSIVQLTDDVTISVHHEMALTMIDGKVHNTIQDIRSQQVCSICRAKPTEMNNIDGVLARPTGDRTQHGISTLHCWIRSMEMFLHIAYRLPFREWQARGEEKQRIVKEQKQRIQTEFRQRLGLLIDQPLPGGSGTTNDGNSARRFFLEHETSADILGLDSTLIRRFSHLLRAASSNFHLDEERFGVYAVETARMLVSQYGWFRMPQSVHKLLIHAPTVSAGMLLPLGAMSEEAQEARNKDFKAIREHHSRQMSRVQSNTDLVHRLLETSDPLISLLRMRRLKTPTTPATDQFPPEVLALLRAPSVEL